MEYTNKDLQKHLQEEHKISPFSEYLKEIVYGGVDGIVTTFAVVAGFAGANAGMQVGSLGAMTVLLFGLANLFADASSMALGNFLSIRSEQDRYSQEEAKERHEVETNPRMEMTESIEILKQQGFSEADAVQLVEIYATNKEYWVNFMMKYELEMEDLRNENPLLTGLATFAAFAFFGAIPLLPYIINPNHPYVFLLAIAATGIALLTLGVLRLRVTKQNATRSIGEVVLIGSVSAVIAYLVGTFFRA